MAGPEVLRQLAEALIRLSEADKGPVAAGRVVRQEAAAKKMAVSLSDRAKEWSEKVMSKDKKTREAAKQKEKEKKSPDKYNNDPGKIDNARNRLVNVQEGDINKTPDGFQKDPTLINSTAIAEYTATLTQMNRIPEEYRDPHVVYAEVAKLYRSIDWEHATPSQKAEARRAIDAGLKYVRELARTAPAAEASEFNQQVLADESRVNYQLNLGISDEKHFDLYRSRQVDLTSDPAPTRNPRPGQRPPPPGESGGKKLDRLLKTAQSSIDGTNTLKSETDALRKTYDQIFRDLKDGKYSETTAGEYRDLIQARMEDLQAQLDAERAPAGGGRGRNRKSGEATVSAKVEEDQQKVLLAGIPSELHRVAKEIFELQDIKNPTLQELQDLAAKYAQKAGGPDKYEMRDRFVRERVGPNASEDVLRAERMRMERNLETLDHIIMDRLRPLLDESQYGRAYFGLHPEHLDFVKAINLKGRSLKDVQNNELKTLFDIAHGIIDRAEDNPRAQFREGMDLYTSDNWKEFVSILRDKAQGANWHSDEIDALSNYFTGIREMRELVHDLQFVGNFAGLEMLEKFTGNTLSGDLDTWIHYTPAMRYASAVYWGQLRNIMAQNGGHLPPEMMENQMIKQAFLDKTCTRQMFEAVKSGQAKELAGMTEKYREGMELIAVGRRDGVEASVTRGEALIAEVTREIGRANKVAKAFGTLTLRTSTMLAEAKLPYVFGSLPENNMVQGMDPVRQLIFKYGLGKDARARFYEAFTHDTEGAHRTLTMSDHEFEAFYYEMEAHPQFGKSIAEFRNLFRVADRFGDGRSFWGMILGMKDFPEEMRELRGVGAKLFDAVGIAAREVRTAHAAEIDAKFGAGASSGDIRSDVEMWWNKRAHDKDIHHEFQQLFEQHINTSFDELIYKLPLEVINRVSLDVGYERLNFDAIEMALNAIDRDLVKKILQNDDGTPLIITKGGRQVTIRSLWDLYNVNTSNRPSDMDVGIPRVMKADLDRRQGIMEAYAYQMKMDLGNVQQTAIDKFWRAADGDTTGIAFQQSDMKEGMLNQHIAPTIDSGCEIFDRDGNVVGTLNAADRRNLARKYINAIDHVTTQPLDTTYHGNPLRRPSYREYLHKRFLEGWESNVFTTVDVPLHKLRYENWGSSVISRTIGDAKNNSTAQFGLWTMMEGLTGHPDPEKIAGDLKDKVLSPMGMADPGLARHIGGFFWDTYINLYRSTDTVSNMGIVGQLLTSEIVLETAKKISKAFGHHGELPAWMYGSKSKRFIATGAQMLQSDGVWKITELAEENSQLPLEDHPLGWAQAVGMPRTFTKEAMRDHYHGNPGNIFWQALSTVSFVGVGMTLYQALTEKDDEHR